jgi:hypothetical protein
MQRTCSNCGHFYNDPKTKNKVCRRYPPTIQPTISQHPITKQAQQIFVSMYPGVEVDLTCGEWTSKKSILSSL